MAGFSSKTGMVARDGKFVTAYRVLIVLGAALVCVAAVLFANGRAEEDRAKKASEAIVARLDEARPQAHVATMPYASRAGDGAMPVEWVDGYDYVGSIAIPAIGVILPVGAITEDARLRDCPCRYQGSYLNDDLVVCGQGYSSHFGRLGSLGIGDEVEFVAVDGTLHSYVVSNVETDELENIDAVLDDWDLTLFTFTGDGRCCVVRCIRESARAG